MNIISYTSIDDFSVLKKNKEYTGQELYSLIIPSRISTTNKGIVVKNGILEKGQLSKDQLGSKKKNSLIHLIWDEYGMDETKEFLDNTQRLINNFNLVNGFSVGMGDLVIPQELKEQMNKLFEKKKLEIDHLITEMEKNPEMQDAETFENTIYFELNAIRDDVSKLIMNNLKPENNFNIMISSGAKGGPVNMGQMVGCIGQQAVEGKRIQKKVNNRSLHYFFQNDDSAIARGFVEDSFLKGANPVGFIFHNMAAREGLIDTAIKTAESGYIQRKLIKSLEDAMIKYDSTVRNANNTILQFTYGDNGIDTTKQSEHYLTLLEMGNKEARDRYSFTKEELSNLSQFSEKQNEQYFNELLDLRDDVRRSRLKSSQNYSVFENNYMLPVNLRRIIDNVKNTNLTSNEKVDPIYIIDKIYDILDYNNTRVLSINKKESKDKDSLKSRDEELCKTVFKFALMQFLSPKICLFELKLNKAKFDEIVKQVITSFNKSVVEPGEMIGTIAAQSIGEP